MYVQLCKVDINILSPCQGVRDLAHPLHVATLAAFYRFPLAAVRLDRD